jgi:hypothetical protein
MKSPHEEDQTSGILKTEGITFRGKKIKSMDVVNWSNFGPYKERHLRPEGLFNAYNR